MRVLACCSGWLGLIGFKTLAKIKGIRIVAVLVDSRSGEIIKLAGQLGIPAFKGNPRINAASWKLPAFDVLMSVNYLFVLPPVIFKKARKLALNIHDSLLPKYMGRTPVTWVIINDEVETGITVHEIVEACDCGPVVYQEKMLIENTDTGGTLIKKMSRRYPVVLRKVFLMFVQGDLKRTAQDLNKRTYCCQRTPQEGLIDWRWSSRKVFNWVRAQTRPYPGAFFLNNGRKYFLWRVTEIFDEKIYKNKTVGIPFLRGDLTYVRCGQCAVRLDDFEPVGF
ncbi:MAG: hypothetical protein HQL16_03195 [Candidatus Omnitrophica bacterium]|nr:hypothetical protein [Candidatus Omnitrophota bacterium]